MSCHSQLYRAAPVLAPLHKAWIDPAAPLAWQRVHDLPDFVYFDHSIHINKGVGCSSCHGRVRSEEHTSELQSLMRISYAVFCLKKKNKQKKHHTNDSDQ